jgi:tetratricopeptide (TPR) repeat protein
LIQTGAAIRVNAKLINSKTEEVFKSFQINRTAEKMMQVIDSLSVQIKNFLIISELKKENRLVQKVTDTNFPEAFKYFIYGLNAMNKSWTEASKFFEQAVAKDTNFISALSWLTGAYCNAGQNDIANYKDAKKWCLKLYQKRDMMSPTDKIQTDYYYAWLFEKPDEQIKYLRQQLLIDDQQPGIYFIIGLKYDQLHQYEKGEILNLKGLALYKTWEVRGGKVWQDSKLDAVGTLEFLGDGNFKFSFSETRPNPNSMAFDGKIGHNGELKFQFPSPLFVDPVNGPFYITDVIKQHACATLSGEGIDQGTVVFYGKFNGERFTATGKFVATVACPCPSNDMFDPAGVNDNLHWIFGYDFTVVP